MNTTNIKMISTGGVDFIINDQGVLLRMINTGERRDITIPDRFKSGEEIKYIAREFCAGRFGRVIISDKITDIFNYAFTMADVFEVKWSKGCKQIPQGCFSESTLEAITNIEDVEEIGIAAFRGCLKGEFIWPDKCKRIPSECFSKSGITAISNIDNVENVGPTAFAGSKLESIKWPSKCKTIPSHCFSCPPCDYGEPNSLESITNIDDVEEIGEYAFGFCQIETMIWPSKCSTIPNSCFASCKQLKNISNIENVKKIEDNAFSGTALTKFIWPSNCTTIPARCFMASKLQTIENIDHVEKIGKSAFERVPMIEFEWPTKCETVPTFCFRSSDLKTLYNTKVIKRIKDDAFFSCGPIEKIKEKKDDERKNDRNVEVECTLPYWLSEAAEKENTDLSELLTETLKEKLKV